MSDGDRPGSASTSIATELSCITGLVNEQRLPGRYDGDHSRVLAAATPVESRVPEPALWLNGELDVPGVGKVRGGGGARGKPAIAALQRVLILGIVVALVLGVVHVVRSPSEGPRHRGLGNCTECVERTPHMEYIERTCTRDGS